MARAEVDRVVGRVQEAQRAFALFSQEQVDKVVDGLRDGCLPNLEGWARLAFEETGYGVIADKTLKNRFCAEEIYDYIRPMKTVGFIASDPARGIYEVAAPMGVVAAVIPSTNPTSTTIYKIMIALKGRNGIVISPHPSARNCILAVAGVLHDAAVSAGAPRGIVGVLEEAGIEDIQYLMRHPGINVILATGGKGLVNAAYSSGKPAYGVGPGNVPAFIERTAVLRKAARDVIAGKSFDWGTICASEQSVIVDSPIALKAKEEFRDAGGYFVDDREKALLEALVVDKNGILNRGIVGRSPGVIASMAGFSVPDSTRALIVPEEGVGRDYPLSLEKLSPILSYFEADGWEAGCLRCIEVLRYGGLGHTLCLHTMDMEVIRQFALKKPAFRIIVNSSGTHGAVGLSTNLPPAMTLGCGALGNNITSDNITPLHLIDRKRVAFESKPISGEQLVLLPPLAEADSGVVSATPPRTGECFSRPAPAERIGRGNVASPLTATGSVLEKSARRFLSQRFSSPRPSEGRRIHTGTGAGIPAAVEDVVDFVCEEDVYEALREGRKIRIHARTLITPSARELGEARGVFKRV